MKEIFIDKRIGASWYEDGITAEYVRGELNSTKKDEDIKIVIDSPGGSVYECISIFNVIRDFCRNHKNKVTTYIQGMAASAASVIALAAHDVNAANKIIVEDNAAYMIHNCWNAVIGNRNDLRSEADAMEKIDDFIQAAVYSRKTGKPVDNVKKLMDAETWLYGQEIVDEGFADEVIKSETPADNVAVSRESVLNLAKSQFNAMRADAEKIGAKGTTERLAACVIGIDDKQSLSENKTPSVAEGQNKGGCMEITAEEFKKDNPEAYAQIVAEAKTQGVEEERKRVSRLLKMGEAAQCVDIAANLIREGRSPNDDDVQDMFFERRLANKVIKDMDEDEASIPAINTPKDGGEADEKAIEAAFDKEIGA